jgi:hypothetical protein
MKTLVSLNKFCIFVHYREVQTIKNLLIDIIFVMKIFFSGDLFRTALYTLKLVLHKDALFHYSEIFTVKANTYAYFTPTVSHKGTK